MGEDQMGSQSWDLRDPSSESHHHRLLVLDQSREIDGKAELQDTLFYNSTLPTKYCIMCSLYITIALWSKAEIKKNTFSFFKIIFEVIFLMFFSCPGPHIWTTYLPVGVFNIKAKTIF